MTIQRILALTGAAACLAVHAPAAHAQTGFDPYLGQVAFVGQAQCPQGWYEANGQILQINQNVALFSLLSTQYGGNGQTTFALPDLRGRALVGTGSTPVGPYVTGQSGGQETAVMNISQMPAHTHNLMAADRPGTTNSPAGADLAEQSGTGVNSYAGGAPTSPMPMATGIIGVTGDAQPFNIVQPSLGMRYCIAYTGIYPPRP
ncbi:phage tail protein [Alkalicaulis satelles]|uniref:Phage tail protein n=1 Tax=Alkalicaulis satelles TaxID=2609175 RepID=A0A5M6ZKK4_9PROT|nr:tail fiber protein [Alkalicaulis satelles]KAA5804860.1 phage tail protein [Alkalicaulis satelles]